MLRSILNVFTLRELIALLVLIFIVKKVFLALPDQLWWVSAIVLFGGAEAFAWFSGRPANGRKTLVSALLAISMAFVFHPVAVTQPSALPARRLAAVPPPQQ